MEFNINDYQNSTRDELLTALSDMCRQNTLLQWENNLLQYDATFYKTMFNDYKRMLDSANQSYDELYSIFIGKGKKQEKQTI